MKDVRAVMGVSNPSMMGVSNPSSASPKMSEKAASGTADDNPFADLLSDAKKIRSTAEVDDTDRELSDAIFSVASKIFTADFFLICAFFVWFIVGALISSFTGNDTVQIAFNGIFQPVVQPALGILMVGAIAGSKFFRR